MEFQTLKPIHVKEEESVLRVLEQFQRGYKHLIVIEKEDNETSSLMKTNCSMLIFQKKAFCKNWRVALSLLNGHNKVKK